MFFVSFWQCTFAGIHVLCIYSHAGESYVDDPGICCVCETAFERWLTAFVGWVLPQNNRPNRCSNQRLSGIPVYSLPRIVVLDIENFSNNTHSGKVGKSPEAKAKNPLLCLCLHVQCTDGRLMDKVMRAEIESTCFQKYICLCVLRPSVFRVNRPVDSEGYFNTNTLTRLWHKHCINMTNNNNIHATHGDVWTQTQHRAVWRKCRNKCSDVILGANASQRLEWILATNEYKQRAAGTSTQPRYSTCGFPSGRWVVYCLLSGSVSKKWTSSLQHCQPLLLYLALCCSL